MKAVTVATLVQLIRPIARYYRKVPSQLHLHGYILPPFRNSYSTNSLTKVLLQTYIEYLRGLVEDKKTINHHGREREIDLDLMNEKPTQVKPVVTQASDLE